MKNPRGSMRGVMGGAALPLLALSARAQDAEELELRFEALNERLEAIEDKQSAGDLLRVQWKDGLRLTSPDNEFDLKIGGRIHFESQSNEADESLEESKRFDADANEETKTKSIGPLEDGFELRRARLYLSGTMYQHLEFKWQYDFAKGTVGHKDVYGGLINVGDWIPNFRFGHMYEPFGLDAMTSSNDSTFIERSAISNAFAPNRNQGFLFWKNFKFDTDGKAVQRITWAAGAFKEDASDNSVATGDGSCNFTARLAGTPYYVSEGRKLVHVGAAVTRRKVAGRGSEGVTYAAKPEVDLFGNFVNPGAMKEADVDWR